MRVRRFQRVVGFALPLAIGATSWSLDASAQSVWADVQGGAGRIDLPVSFSDFAPMKVEPALGLGAGLRFSAWTVGLRGELVPTTSFTFYQGVIEAAFRPSLGRWEPYVGVRGGYTTMSMKPVYLPSLTGVMGSPIPIPSPHGPDLGMGLGLDFRVTPLLAVGVGVAADALLLSTSAGYFDLSGDAKVLVQAPSSGVGSAIVASLHAAAQFDL
jgi:hypothetical protein